MKNNLQAEIALSVRRALAKPDGPLPVTGWARLPGLGSRVPVFGFMGQVGGETPGVALEIEAVEPLGKPRHRPADDGRRIAVLLAFEVLTVADGLGKTAAGEAVARLLGYGGEREVRKVLKQAPTLTARERGRVLVAAGSPGPGQPRAVALLATGGDLHALDSILDARPGTERYNLSGWRWQWGEGRATRGYWCLSVTK